MSDQPTSSTFPAAGSAFRPFRHRIFLAIWLASLVANLGSMVQAVGAAWLMTAIANSAEMVALVQTAMLLPVMLFSLASGALADIYDRRLVMLGAQLMMLSVSIVLVTLSYFGLLTPWLLLLLTFLLGSGFALNQPAWQASVREQVPGEDVPAAISLNSLTFNIARCIGPAMGGAIIAIGGPQSAFAANTLTYVGVIVVLVSWRRALPQATLRRERIGSAMRAGLQYVRLSPSIRTVCVRTFAFGLCASAIMALMPLIARELVGGGPVTLGLLLGAFGAGSIAGALLGEPVRSRFSKEGAARMASILFGAAVIVIAFSPVLVLTMAAMAVAGASWVLVLATLNVTVQMSSPSWVVGRALAIYQMVVFGGMAFGSWFWGVLAEERGVPAALGASGVALFATLALGLRWRLPQDQPVSLEPASRRPLPDIQIDIDPESGPVFVTMEYRVPEPLSEEFLSAMAEEGRIRRRDGARRWTLLQDTADPELWIERFESPTWHDYLRQRTRTTVDDRAIEERVRSFHRDSEPPRVRRLVARVPAETRRDAEASATDLLRHPILPQGGLTLASEARRGARPQPARADEPMRQD